MFFNYSTSFIQQEIALELYRCAVVFITNIKGTKRACSTMCLMTITSVMADMLDAFVTDNSTANGDVPNATESEIQETLTLSKEELIRILNLVIRPVLIVFGTIGNGLSFYIMRQGSLKKMSTCFYLSILALIDTSKCGVFCFILIRLYGRMICHQEIRKGILWMYYFYTVHMNVQQWGHISKGNISTIVVGFTWLKLGKFQWST